MGLLDDWPAKERRIGAHVERTVADHLAAGRSVFYGDGGDEIIREDPGGRRFVVQRRGTDFEIVREIDSR